jgi:hypothetical protein
MQCARSRWVQIALVETVRLNMGQVGQLLHAGCDRSLIGIGNCGCALFSAQRMLLGGTNADIVRPDTPFRKSMTGDHNTASVRDNSSAQNRIFGPTKTIKNATSHSPNIKP